MASNEAMDTFVGGATDAAGNSKQINQMSLHFIGQPFPTSTADAQIVSRFQQGASSLLQTDVSAQTSLPNGDPIGSVKKIVLGQKHVAFLLQSDEVMRCELHVDMRRALERPERSQARAAGASSGGSAADRSSALAQAYSFGTASSNDAGGTDPLSCSQSALASRSAKIRRVMMAARPGRSGRGVIVGSRQAIPASAIPEELIAQAQVVLQGKSREVIIRELQRTNLNVNEAVNNLLSRDDEDGDDGDEGGGTDAYLPEELLTLLDAGLQEHPVVLDGDTIYSADVFDYALARDLARRKAERDSSRPGGLQRSTGASSGAAESGGKDAGSASDARGRQAAAVQPPFTLDTTKCTYWTDQNGARLRMTDITGLYSDLVGIDEATGAVLLWPWTSPVANTQPEPLFSPSNLLPGEKCAILDSSYARCTVVSTEGRVGSLVDASLGAAVKTALDQALMWVEGLQLGAVQSVHTSLLYSLVNAHNTQAHTHLYWWGVIPFNERRKRWEKSTSSVKKHVTFDVNDISVGSLVRLKMTPIYGQTAWGFTFHKGYPQVGQLMESAYTLSEICRFRVMTGNDLKSATPWVAEDSKEHQSKIGEKRKRVPTPPAYKEEAWCLKDVTFVYEGRSQDIGKVVKVDGAYCGVLFGQSDWNLSAAETMSSMPFDQLFDRIRLVRKDELQVVSHPGVSRAPVTLQLTPTKIAHQNPSHKILAVAVGSNDMRALVHSRASDKLHLLRLTLSAKTMSDHPLPIQAGAFLGNNTCVPSLFNCGDDSLLLVRDGSGCLLCLQRDSLNEMQLLNNVCLPPVSLLAGAVHSLALLDPPPPPGLLNTRAVRVLGLAAVLHTSALMQAILAVDIERVKQVFSQMHLDDAEELILRARLSGNMNVLHACVVMCVAESNKAESSGEQQPSSTAASASTQPQQRSTDPFDDAAAHRQMYEARWEQLVSRRMPRTGNTSVSSVGAAFAAVAALHDANNNNNNNNNTAADGANQQQQQQQQAGNASASSVQPAASADAQNASSRYPLGSVSLPDALGAPKADGSGQPAQSSQSAAPVIEGGGVLTHTASAAAAGADDKNKPAQARHVLAQQIMSYMIASPSHPYMSQYVWQLMSDCDQQGRSPFMLAISSRAFSAAVLLWECALKLASAQPGTLLQVIWPQHKQTPAQQDSPLFTLCYNDTCSFTWTGVIHINQDIFECRTCGLVGSLCCCTECAYTCHKDHDCKLKKTSPTAYCDCWERCSCKALIAGSQKARFQLLNEMLAHTDLVTRLNSSGEHILLFLMRTVCRQQVEQSQAQGGRKVNRASARDQRNTTNVPEHDLEPPKFARQALNKLLTNYSAVKSLILCGVKDVNKEAAVTEDQFFLDSQNGVAQLDKFVFTLVCRSSSQDYLDMLVSTLIAEAQAPAARRDADVQQCNGRFVRSLVRVFTLLNLSHNSATAKRSVLTKLRRALQCLVSYACVELAAAADAVIAPVRLGLLKASLPLPTVSMDAIAEDVNRFFSSEANALGEPGEWRAGGKGALKVPSAVLTVDQGALGADTSMEETQDDDDRHDTLHTENEDDEDTQHDTFMMDESSREPPLSSLHVYADEGDDDDDDDDDDENDWNTSRDDRVDDSAVLADDAGSDASDESCTSDEEEDTRRPGAQHEQHIDVVDDNNTAGNATANGAEANGGSGSQANHTANAESVSNGAAAGNSSQADAALNSDNANGNSASAEASGFGSWLRGRNAADAGGYGSDGESEQSDPPNQDEDDDRESAGDTEMQSAAVDLNDENEGESDANSEPRAGGGQQQRGQTLWGNSAARAAGTASSSAPASQQQEQGTQHSSNASVVRSGTQTSSNTAGSGNAVSANSAGSGSSTTTGRRGTTTEGSSSVRLRNPVFDATTDSSHVPASSSSNTQSSAAAAPSGTAASHEHTAHQLARLFDILVRTLADMLRLLHDNRSQMPSPGVKQVLIVSTDQAKNIQTQVQEQLQPTWHWLYAVLDTTEAQLRFGAAVAARLPQKDPAEQLPWTLMFGQPGAAAGGSSTSTATTTAAAAQPTSTTAAATAASGTGSSSTAAATASSRRGNAQQHDDYIDMTSQAARRRILLQALHSSQPQVAALMTRGLQHSSPTDGTGSLAHRQLIGYVCSLLRAHAHEHANNMPMLDLSALRPVSYVCDALFVLETTCDELLAHKPDQMLYDQAAIADVTFIKTPTKPIEQPTNKFSPAQCSGEQKTRQTTSGPRTDDLHRFFVRSKSMSYIGISGEQSPFASAVHECVPLADRPHLLTPNANTEHMFGQPDALRTHAQHAETLHNSVSSTCLSLAAQQHNILGGNLSADVSARASPETSPTKATAANDPAAPPASDSPVSADSSDQSTSERSGRRITRATSKQQQASREASVIVHTQQPSPDKYHVSQAFLDKLHCSAVQLQPTQELMGRWKLALKTLSKYFGDEVGLDAQSVYLQVAAFSVREQRFRKEMDKLRANASFDLVLDVDRDEQLLIQQTIKQINNIVEPRTSGESPSVTHKVKVMFKGEQGEGTGVARSFYAAFAQALTNGQKLPNLEHCQPSRTAQSPGRQQLYYRMRGGVRRRTSNQPRVQLDLQAPAFYPGLESSSASQQLGERLYPFVNHYLSSRPMTHSYVVAKITGMLVEEGEAVVNALLRNEAELHNVIDLALQLVNNDPQSADNSSGGSGEVGSALARAASLHQPVYAQQCKKTQSTPNLNKAAILDLDELIDNSPLFFQPGKTGFFSPAPGKSSTERINAFRNVGRVIGVCLSQNELFPLPLCRHVFKVILGRPINWYDLAFFDPTLFESLRALAQYKESFEDFHLTFAIDLLPEEGGGTVDLKPNGSKTVVTNTNVVEYIYRYVEYRMIFVARHALQALHDGVFDVLPRDCLKTLSAEDLRLILCGTHDINVAILQSYTAFVDESSGSAEQLARVKRWFWSVVNKMDDQQKQELVYFWTGSPTLPSSEEGFTPLPSVYIRPADDEHLPTANTCISRLYVPLYSNKHTLKHKLLLAIKARNFGFV